MFQVRALPAEPFAALFGLPDAALAARGARRQVADAKPGFPCRVSLADAEPGEAVILTRFQHQPADTPFRASHAVYVRAGAEPARPRPGEVPVMLRSRMLSLRAFDIGGMMVDAGLVDGRALEAAAERMLGGLNVAYLHAHFAAPGCYACRLDRA